MTREFSEELDETIDYATADSIIPQYGHYGEAPKVETHGEVPLGRTRVTTLEPLPRTAQRTRDRIADVRQFSADAL